MYCLYNQCIWFIITLSLFQKCCKMFKTRGRSTMATQSIMISISVLLIAASLISSVSCGTVGSSSSIDTASSSSTNINSTRLAHSDRINEQQEASRKAAANTKKSESIAEATTLIYSTSNDAITTTITPDTTEEIIFITSKRKQEVNEHDKAPAIYATPSGKLSKSSMIHRNQFFPGSSSVYKSSQREWISKIRILNPLWDSVVAFDSTGT